MQIDLTNPNDFTLDNVRKLIASGNDSEDTQIRVNRNGIAFLIAATGAEKKGPDILFRVETWDAGSGLVGVEAAKDERWVRDVYFFLKKNWPIPMLSSMEVDQYPDHQHHPME